MQRKSRYLYAVMPLVLAALLMALTLIGCGREQAAVQGVSHFEGPLDITGAGSASAPALYLAGDSNSGVYQSAADNFDITIAGVRVGRFRSAGLDVFGTISATNAITTVGQILAGTWTVGSDGTGHDVIYYSDTAGDSFHWDDTAVLFITGTNSATAFKVSDGEAVVADGLTSALITATSHAEVDGTLNVDGAVTLNSTLDVDGNITSGTGAISITDGVYITGTVDVDGAVTLNSTLDVDGAISSGTGGITLTDSAGVFITTGGLDVTGNITMENDETIANSVNGIITLTATTVAQAGNGVVTGALDVQGGDITLQNDESISNGYNGVITYTATTHWFSGNVTASGLITVGTFLQLSPGAPQTIITGTAGITPTTSLHQLTSAGTVANTMSVTGFTAGQVVVLVNVGSNTITITDTGTTKLSANIALGQYDTLMVYFDGTNWVQISTTDN